MSLPLRTTFGNRDYTYRILTRVINKETTSIKFSLEEEEFTMEKGGNGNWQIREASLGDYQLLEAVAKSICKRYAI
ncbi:hypothetical protein [Desertivirga xinjiangensis]|uniref:hypothetical protein n=1 Tax=Desertivirga xinjiangensis TaxID=539206 RepID=UPI00210AEF86|nr:hypothetical protein [Pedobacter xinjiangensis]